MVTKEFILKALQQHMYWNGKPVVAYSDGVGGEGPPTACIIIEERPFNKWVPLDDMDKSDFTEHPFYASAEV